MVDIYRYLMTKTPEYEYHDTPIEELSVSALSHFVDADGAFTRSFDLTLKGKAEHGVHRSIPSYPSHLTSVSLLKMYLISVTADLPSTAVLSVVALLLSYVVLLRR